MIGSRVVLVASAFVVLAGIAAIVAGCGRPAHGDGMVVNGVSDCESCHLGDYNATSSPIHSSVGFPVTCADCHVTTTWLGAVGKHSAQAEAKFPVGSGRHSGIACDQCHDSALSQDYSKNPNCTASECHNGAGQTARLHTKPDFLNGHDNGASTWANHNGDTNKMFCLDSGCHPGGGGAQDGG